MNNIQIRGENVEVTQSLKNYTNQKLGKLERYFGKPIKDVFVNFKVYKVGQKVEVTIPISGMFLRAEETHEDLYAAIDLVVGKLEGQIRKHKTKVNRRVRESAKVIDIPFVTDDLNEETDDLVVVRKKTLALKPMSEDEAILQMELIGHQFYVFIDANTEQASIVYKRKDGKYGLIETN
ncbi:ribosome hibernation-promoting factor, HPF/YfiA family [Viridibacillus arvi]|uniref:ribosome hibernation-promoting factor, HPF/YfiA family n=1 Tax=Viridibacillus arvi TaxID=263475 RepID=UPI0034CDF48A